MQVEMNILLGSVAGLVGAILYAISVVIYRSLSDDIHPIAVSSIKMWVSFLFMLVIILFFHGTSFLMVPIEAWLILTGSIVLGAVIGDTLYLISQTRIGVSYAFPIAMTFPVLTFGLAIVILGEPVILSRIFGALIAVAGTIVLALEQNKQGHELQYKKRDTLGFILAITTTILYAVAIILVQVGLNDYSIDAITGNFIRVFSGGMFFIPIFLIAHQKGMKTPSLQVTKIIAIAGFFGMAIGALLYVYAIEQAGAAITSVVASTAPLFAVPFSIYYLKEKLTKRTIFGIIATVIGVVLVVFGG